MNTRSVGFLWLVTLLAVSLPVSAHHGAAAYDETKEVVLKNATVTKYTWANPHTIIEADVKDDKGNLVHWVGEVGSPSAIGNQGWTKASIAPGDVITMYLHQSKTGRPIGRVSHVLLADGTQLRDSAGTSGVGGGGDEGGMAALGAATPRIDSTGKIREIDRNRKMRKTIVWSDDCSGGRAGFLSHGDGQEQAKPGSKGSLYNGNRLKTDPAPGGPAPVHDLNGSWAGNLVPTRLRVPPLTPLGQKLASLNHSEPEVGTGNSNDPGNTCDPLGVPRSLEGSGSLAGISFATMPDRIAVLQEYQTDMALRLDGWQA